MLTILCAAAVVQGISPTLTDAKTWTADNGNGTYSNPLFFDEFSDPDMIRVGDDYYLTGTTMHTMPGLPVLHSKDLVNWEFLSYASDKLDFGPDYRLEGGKSVYGRGIWAPCFRYRNGTFYIFSNVLGRGTQLYTSRNPRGPWVHKEMKRGFHDLSVLFDDDGKAYIVYGYKDLHIAQLNEALDDILPETEQTPFGSRALIGEGSHFYKVNGKYYITSAWYETGFRMPCARADSPFGPYELNLAISKDETFGLTAGNRLRNAYGGTFEINGPNPSGGPEWAAMHQGGIVQTQKGDWWGWSMMDANSVGRLTALSPVTWKDGWPYFGLPGNLGRTPRTWFKPDIGAKSKPSAPYQRSDSFSGPQLSNVWQWNHVPDNSMWSLKERKGHLRLHALPASTLWDARNTLTQRAIGPDSSATVVLDTDGLRVGDSAGLALFNYPYARIGAKRSQTGLSIEMFDQAVGNAVTKAFPGGRLWLRATCDFMTEKASMSYSLDGVKFTRLGAPVTMVYQLRTFQGYRYGLYCFGAGGGFADFSQFRVDEPHPNALTKPIPIGRKVVFTTMATGRTLVAGASGISNALVSTGPTTSFEIVDRKKGCVALKAPDGRFVSVKGLGEESEVSLAKATGGQDQVFMWTEMPRGDLMLLSLASHRYLRLLADGSVKADAPGAQYDRQNGASLVWQEVPKP